MIIDTKDLQIIDRALDDESWGFNPKAWQLDKAQAALDSILTFTTKEEYLAWAADWKSQYAALSVETRSLKIQRKTSLPSYNPNARDLVWINRTYARALLFIRRQSKYRAAKQRAARIAQPVV